MSVRERVRGWRRRRRRRRAARKRRGALLREFVYLDDVSVYSLYASRLGAVAKEFTDTESSSLRSEVGGTGSASAGVVKSQISSRLQASETTGSQVVRQSIVQATFKELYESEEEALVLRATLPEADVPTVGTPDALVAAAGEEGSPPWIVDASALQRGALLECEVELEAEGIFRMSATLSALLELVEENPELVGAADREGVLEGMTVSRVLERLLAGLVPLRGRAVNYQQVTIEGKEWVVHEEVLKQLSERHGLEVQPVHVVGVAEADLFWKDIRRVAFSHSRYIVMCRVNRDGLQASWTPVKLVEVLEEFVPDLARELDAGSRGLLTAMVQPDALSGSNDHEQLMRRALVEYAAALAAHHGHSCGEDDLVAAGLPTAEHCRAYEPIEARREAFDALSDYLEERYSIPRNRLVETQLRGAALLDSGLGLDGQPLALPSPAVAASAVVDTPGRYLDAEFVAIYW